MKNRKDVLKTQFDAFKGQQIDVTTHIQGGKNPDTGGSWVEHTYSTIGGIDHEPGGDLSWDFAVAADVRTRG
ncbi:MAG: hypothetical protein AB8F95_01870 [Bacteroidia bacterium]